ncbi:MAG: DHHA1 domain-containing protein [Gammaproteobacteria bacterium]|nr:DHHA1 domain-containing protein [Gammaproteobacteria bacterium]
MDDKKIICIYHGGCTDGFGAAFAVWKKFGDAVEYHKGVYGYAPPDCTGHDVYIVDFSYKRDVMEQIARVANSVTVLDHHKTAREDLEGLLESGVVRGEFDMGRSGAVITWQYLHDTPVPQLLLHIQDRDLWKFEFEETKNIVAALFSRPFEFTAWDYYTRPLGENDLPLLALEGDAINRAHRQYVEKLKEHTRHLVICGYAVPTVNCPWWFASDVAGELSEGHALGATYMQMKDNIVFNLRTRRDDIDVSEIAKRYGGGGHAKAAGFAVRHLGELQG